LPLFPYAGIDQVRFEGLPLSRLSASGLLANYPLAPLTVYVPKESSVKLLGVISSVFDPMLAGQDDYFHKVIFFATD
jgi:hypothetical protein